MQQVKTNIAEQIKNLQTNAVAKHKAGKIEEAISLYLAAIEVDENQPAWIYGNVIILLSQVGRLDEGLRLGEKAEKIHPESDKICRGIGKVLYEAKRFSESIKYYQQAIKLVPEQPSWLFSDLVAQLVELKRFDEAVEFGNKGIKFYQGSEWLYFHLGIALVNLTEYDKAGVLFEKIEARRPDFWRINNVDCDLHKINRQPVQISKQLINIKENPENNAAKKNDFKNQIDLIKKLTKEKKLTKAIADQIKTNLYQRNRILTSCLKGDSNNLFDQQVTRDYQEEIKNELVIQLNMCEPINGYGWCSPEKNGRWTGDTQRSSLVLPQLSEGAYIFEMLVISEAFKGLLRRLKLYVNDQVLNLIIIPQNDNKSFPVLVHGNFVISEQNKQSFLPIIFLIDKSSYLYEIKTNESQLTGIQVNYIKIRSQNQDA